MIKVQVSTLEGQLLDELSFTNDEVTIGRVRGNEVVLGIQGVSKRHARLSVRDGQLHVIDLKSTNGTLVRGQKITVPVAISPSDIIRIADFHLRAAWLPSARRPVANAPADDGIQTMEGIARRHTGNQSHQPLVPMPGHLEAVNTDLSGRPAQESSEQRPSSVHRSGTLPSFPNGASSEPSVAHRDDRPPAPLVHRDANAHQGRGSSTVDMPATASGTRPLVSRPTGRTTLSTLHNARPKTGHPSAAVLTARTSVVSAAVRSHVEIMDGASWPPTVEQRAAIEAAITSTVDRNPSAMELTSGERTELLTLLVDDLVGLGPLDHWLDDDNIDAVTILGPEEIWLQHDGSLRLAPWGFASAALLARSVDRLIEAAGLDESVGGTLSLPDGTVLHITPAQNHPALVSAHRSPTASSAREIPATDGAEAALARAGGVLLFGTDPVVVRSCLEAILRRHTERSAALRTVICSDASMHPGAGQLGRSHGAVANALSLASDLVVIEPLDADSVAELMTTTHRWAPAILATTAASTPHGAIQRLAASAAAVHGLPYDATRSWLAATFECLVAVNGRDESITLTPFRLTHDGTIQP